MAYSRNPHGESLLQLQADRECLPLQSLSFGDIGGADDVDMLGKTRKKRRSSPHVYRRLSMRFHCPPVPKAARRPQHLFRLRVRVGGRAVSAADDQGRETLGV